MTALTNVLPVLPDRGVRVATENTGVAGVAGVAGFFKGPHGENSFVTPFERKTDLNFRSIGPFRKSGNTGNAGNKAQKRGNTDPSKWQHWQQTSEATP